MLEFLTLLTLFAQPVFYCILSIFKIQVASGQMGILFILIAILGYLYIIKKNLFSKKIKIRFLLTAIVILIILMFCIITILNFGYTNINDAYRGQILSFGSASIVACLWGYTLSQESSIKKLGKWIPIFVIVLTLITFITTITSKETTSGGQISSSSGLVYQNLSYYAAYAFGLNMYFITNMSRFETFEWVKKISVLFIILAPIQALTVMLGGGRGGFVLFAVLCLYFLIINFEAIKKNPKYILSIFLVFIVAVVIILILNYSGLNKTGWERILSFFDNLDDNNRSDFRSKAITCFKMAPLLGNGIGSVFYYTGFYSHNIFTDLLCDTGMFGISLFGAMLILYFIRQRKQIKYDNLNRFVFIVFMMGFIMSMFSGYYLSNQLLWFALGFVLNYNMNRIKKRK